MKNYLWASSLIFLLNGMHAFYNDVYEYGILFFLLTLTSITVHLENVLIVNVLDKIVIACIVLYGILIIYQNQIYRQHLNFAVILGTFLACIIFYVYGFFNHCFCFDLKPCVAQKFHCLMHVVGSLGHHAILFCAVEAGMYKF